jgi:hypothetical protein
VIRSLLVAVVAAVVLVPSSPALAVSDRSVLTRGRTPCSIELPRVSWRPVKVSQRVRRVRFRASVVVPRVNTMRRYRPESSDVFVIAGRPTLVGSCD